jgi:hypothetical protein
LWLESFAVEYWHPDREIGEIEVDEIFNQIINE